MAVQLPNFAYSAHLYILFDKSGRYFKFAQSHTPTSRRQHLKPAWCDVDRSFIIQFPRMAKPVSMPELAELMLAHMAAHRVTHAEMGGRVYDAQAWAPTYEAFLARLAESGSLPLAPLRTFVPENAAERAALEAAEVAAYEEAERQEEAARAAKSWQLHLEDVQLRRQSRNAAIEKALEEGRVLHLDDAKEEKGKAIADLFSQLDALANGWLERLVSDDGDNLQAWIWSTHSGEFDRIVRQLSSYRLFSEPLEKDADGDYPRDMRLCEQLPVSAHKRVRAGASARCVGLAARGVAAQFLARLAPGIRGWDLPLVSVHRGFDPTKSSKYSGNAPAPAPTGVRAVWAKALTEIPYTLRQVLQDAGLLMRITLPHTVRYYEESPFPGDERAPLMLVRLVTEPGKPVGFHAVNLRTRTTQDHFFDAPVDTAWVSIWNEQPSTMVATSVADALAMNKLFKIPVLIMPSPAALHAYQPGSVVEKLKIYLTRDFSQEWAYAAGDAHVNGSRRKVKVTCLVPPPTGAAGRPAPKVWAEYLPTVPKRKPIPCEAVQFDFDAEDGHYELDEAVIP